MDLTQLDKFMKQLNQVRKCATPGCQGSLTPVHVKSVGLGGAITIGYIPVMVVLVKQQSLKRHQSTSLEVQIKLVLPCRLLSLSRVVPTLLTIKH